MRVKFRSKTLVQLVVIQCVHSYLTYSMTSTRRSVGRICGSNCDDAQRHSERINLFSEANLKLFLKPSVANLRNFHCLLHSVVKNARFVVLNY